jgi:hypothetical protein
MGKGLCAIALVVSVGMSACFLTGGACDPGYDDKWATMIHCDGDVVKSTDSACGQGRTTTLADCGALGQVCVEGQSTCFVPCQDDSCVQGEYCAKPGGTFGPPWYAQAPGARGVCMPRLPKGSDCTQANDACADGLVCDWTTDPQLPLAVCGPDCTKTDPSARRCPDGAESICIGDVVNACDVCGVASASTVCSRDPGGAHTCVQANGQAFCARSQPREIPTAR